MSYYRRYYTSTNTFVADGQMDEHDVTNVPLRPTNNSWCRTSLKWEAPTPAQLRAKKSRTTSKKSGTNARNELHKIENTSRIATTKKEIWKQLLSELTNNGASYSRSIRLSFVLSHCPADIAPAPTRAFRTAGAPNALQNLIRMTNILKLKK